MINVQFFDINKKNIYIYIHFVETATLEFINQNGLYKQGILSYKSYIKKGSAHLLFWRLGTFICKGYIIWCFICCSQIPSEDETKQKEKKPWGQQFPSVVALSAVGLNGCAFFSASGWFKILHCVLCLLFSTRH